MNEQQIQQLLTFQQAIAAAATAAVLNSILNPQQAAAANALNAAANANALTASDNQQQQQHHQANHNDNHFDGLAQSPNASPVTTPASTPANTMPHDNARLQELLLQLQQQASLTGQSPLALNLNHLAAAQQQAASLASSGSPSSRSPVAVNRLNNNNNHNTSIITPTSLGQELNLSNSATTSNIQTHSNQTSPIKKLKRHHHQQAFQNKSFEATSNKQPQHSPPKNHSAMPTIGARSNTSSSSSSSAFLPTNVGLPRKLVRGQDVWLGRGAEQTRQILKCMWCGQSFRTLAEMTQHMKITQHYTNIISQEQITSWRQPENSSSNNNKHSKQLNSSKVHEENHDEFSEKFEDSDRDDNFSNEDELEQRENDLSTQSRLDLDKSDSTDNNSVAGSTLSDSVKSKNTQAVNPSKSRSKRRANEHSPTLAPKRTVTGEEKSPTTSSSSQKRQNGSTVAKDSADDEPGKINQFSESSEDEEETKEIKRITTKDNSETSATVIKMETEDDRQQVTKAFERDESNSPDINDENDIDTNDRKQDRLSRIEENSEEENTQGATTKNTVSNASDIVAVENGDKADCSSAVDDDERTDMDDDRGSELDDTPLDATGGPKSIGPKGETGDPLSALETMVEKSFDPRLRPGVANGGILQRLGIDEEVCPPWQHINYANWYAAAAYGHPMAAALLAAGINLQNGIKLSKNLNSKKNDD